MISYNRSDQHDILIAQWWSGMRQAGEFDSVFTEHLYPLGAFMEFWRGPCALIFDADDLGITVAMWFQPAMSGAFAGLWVRPDKRRSLSILEQIELGYSSALCHWPVLMGVTKQEHLLKAHRKLGYEVLGLVPNIWNGESAWIVVLTREKWDGRRRVSRDQQRRAEPSSQRS